MSVKGIILKASYYLHRHRIGPIPAGYAPLILAAATLIAAITRLLAWQWVMGSTIVALVLATVVWLTGQQGYIVFRPGQFAPLQVEPLQVDEKVAGRATGCFEVGGKRRYFVEARVYFSTVGTREHILMTCIPHTRFLLIATSPRDEVGWWYSFFQPRMLRAVKTGEIHFGMRPRPALRVTYQPEASSAQIVYLSFDDVNSLYRVLDDLRLDAGLL
jgi:hypothetical protein